MFLRWERVSDRPGERCGPVAEFECLSSLVDVAVPRALDLLWLDGMVVSVTEWIEGRPLTEDSTCSPTSLARTLCRVLRRTHVSGWVHGDIKPGNVLLSPDRGPVLVDWDFATQHGSPSLPGTPGWAPPQAWEPGYLADPAHDAYSAAVVVWEVLHATTAFHGSAQGVAAAQRSFDFFAPTSPLSAPILSLFRAATEGAAVPRVSPFDTVLSLDPAALAELSARQAQGVEQTTSAGLIYNTRVRDGRSSFALADVAHWIDCTVSRSPIPAGATRSDRGRGAWYCAAEQVLRSLSVTTRPLIVGDSSSTGRGVHLRYQRVLDVCDMHFRGAISYREASHSCASAWSPEHARRRDVIRSALAACLSTREVPEQLLRAATVSSLDRAEELLAVLRKAVRSRRLKMDPTAWVVAGQLPFDTSTAADSGAMSRELEHEPYALGEDSIARIEQWALVGDVRRAYRGCVQLTTHMLATGSVSATLIPHIIDLWLDIGQFDCCRSLLTRFNAQLAPEYICRTTARIAMYSGVLDGAKQLADQFEAVARSPEDRLTVARLRAVWFLHDNNALSATASLRAARKIRRTAATWARLEAALTAANVARLRQRPQRARSVLRTVERVASRTGAIRLVVAARINALLSDDSPAHRTQAEAWESIFSTAHSAGLCSYASYAGSLGVRAWLAAGSPSSAEALLQRWRDSEFHSAHSSSRAAELLAAGAAAVADASDDVRRLHFLLESARRTPEMSARSLALASEFQRDADRADVRAVLGSRVGAVRLVRLVCRRPDRAHWSTARLRWLLIGIEQYASPCWGVLGHSIRALVRAPRIDVAALLELTRRLLAAGDVGTDVAVAIHGLALTWRSSSVSGDGCAWFLECAGRERTVRPAGVRAWEFELAHAVAESREMLGVPEARARMLGVSAAIHAFVMQLPEAWAPDFMRSVPLDAVLHVAVGFPRMGTPEGGALAVAEGGGGVIDKVMRLLDLSAPLRGSREAELERVLHSALRLRSSTSVDEVLGETVAGVLEVCRAERAVALFDLGPGGVRAKVGTVRGVTDLPASKAEISHTVLARVRGAAGAVVIDDAAAEESLGDRPSVRKYRPRSVMVCPLRTPSRYLGYLYVENRSRPRSFSGADPEMLEGFAAQAALALENAALVEDLRTSYRDLSRARSEAVRAESLRALGRLATEVAHDLNNLLTAIMGESQLLLTDIRFRDAYASLRVIERAAQDGAECIRRIQDSTRVRPAAEFEELDVVQLLRDVLEFTRVRCAPKAGRPESGIRVNYSTPSRALVRGVPGELREVFTNLAVNAIEAMADGGDLNVRVVCNDSDVRVDISDTGCGIAADVLSRLFEPFFTTKGERGNGLGLSIAQGVVRRHGGEIELESELGRGTTVHVRLPRIHTGIEFDDQASPRGAETLRGAKRFLIVDDDASVLRVLEQMLTQAGVEVDAVVGGDAAVAKIEHGRARYDCVITDLYMPRVSGLDVAECVQRRSPETAIVVMSGCSTSLESEATRSRGISQMIRKPFAIDAIRRLVDRSSS